MLISVTSPSALLVLLVQWVLLVRTVLSAVGYAGTIYAVGVTEVTVDVCVVRGCRAV